MWGEDYWKWKMGKAVKDSVRFTVYRADIYTQYKACRPYQGDSLILPVTGMCPGTPFLMDFDSNLYTTVQIGGQCWMRENMKSIHYSNGDQVVGLLILMPVRVTLRISTPEQIPELLRSEERQPRLILALALEQ
jgi:hypothetical protein